MKKSILKWSITYKRHSEISPLEETGICEPKIKNKSKTSIYVKEFLVHFSWLKGRKCYRKNCGLELKPKKSGMLPEIKFIVPPTIKLGSHSFNVGINCVVKEKDGDWEERDFLKKHNILIRKSEPKGFKVFISHKTGDEKILKRISDVLINCGFDVYVAEFNHRSKNLWTKLSENIDNSDCFLLLWTKNSSKSVIVREEIGYIVGKKRKDDVVIFSKSGLEPCTSLENKEYVPINHKNVDESVEKLITLINDVYENNLSTQRHI